jgi:hypothetical protein
VLVSCFRGGGAAAAAPMVFKGYKNLYNVKANIPCSLEENLELSSSFWL